MYKSYVIAHHESNLGPRLYETRENLLRLNFGALFYVLNIFFLQAYGIHWTRQRLYCQETSSLALQTAKSQQKSSLTLSRVEGGFIFLKNA